LMRLGITAGPVMGAAAIISLLIYSRYNLTREMHREVITALNVDSHPASGNLEAEA